MIKTQEWNKNKKNLKKNQKLTAAVSYGYKTVFKWPYRRTCSSNPLKNKANEHVCCIMKKKLLKEMNLGQIDSPGSITDALILNVLAFLFWKESKAKNVKLNQDGDHNWLNMKYFFYQHFHSSDSKISTLNSFRWNISLW